jgi:hypothetical protein
VNEPDPVAALAGSVRVFKLADRRGHGDGPYCGPDGLYLAGAALVAQLGTHYRVRADNEAASGKAPENATYGRA